MIQRTLAVLTAGAATFASCAAIATASGQTVTEAIKAQDKIVHSNPAYKSLQHFDVKTVAEAKAAIPKFRSVEKLVTNAANAVASASATPAQKAGQNDWVSGARGVSRGIGMLITALTDIEHGKAAAAKSEAVTALKTVRAGNVTGTKGDKLLHLPTSD